MITYKLGYANNITDYWITLTTNIKQSAQNIQCVVSAIEKVLTVTSFSRKLNVQHLRFSLSSYCSQKSIVMVMNTVYGDRKSISNTDVCVHVPDMCR